MHFKELEIKSYAMGVRVNPKIVLVKDQMINRYREGETKFSDKVYLLKNEAFIETFKSVVNFFLTFTSTQSHGRKAYHIISNIISYYPSLRNTQASHGEQHKLEERLR